MKSAYLLFAAGVISCGLLAGGCVSGDTVNGSGGHTGSGSGGHTSSGSGGSSFGSGGSSFGSGGSSFGSGGSGSGAGGFTGGGSGGFTAGGAGGTLGGTGGTVVSGPCTVAATDALIDDFEKAANGVAHACVHGYWYTYNDGSAGTQTPAVNTWMNVAITDRPGSTMAAHSTATGFTGDTSTPKNIFAGFGLNFDPVSSTSTMNYPVNASSFRGVTFFAKGSGTMSVEIPTPKTDPTLGCVSTATSPCYDVSFKIITLTSTWTQFTLLWTDFAQVGYGAKDNLDGSTIGGIKFESKVTAPATTFTPYDMWLDDLKFLQ